MKPIKERIIKSLVVTVMMASALLFASNTASAEDDSSITTYEETIEINKTLPIAGVSLVLYETLSDNTASINSTPQYIVGSALIEENDTDIVALAQEESGDATYSVEDADYTQYTYTKLRVRQEPSTESDCIGILDPGESIQVTGNITDANWVQIEYKEDVAYVCSDYIQDEDFELSTYNYSWDGRVLNSQNGNIAGPSGNETYYNLPMERVVYYMNCLGYNYDYWVRDDGVKMFGQYVMVAADLSIRPKGTLVETSLGTGIVCDTGDFVNWDSTRLDIATSW